jgi:DNA-directed RNA polymerase specialized sigma24 family protein
LSETIFPNIDQLSSDRERHFAIDAVSGLGDFERFVFVMSVLEHYSEHDCALLLGCSVREIREGRAHAFRELMESSHGDPSRSQPFVGEKT